MSAVKGVSSEGFITIVQPHARAGATFHALVKISSFRPRYINSNIPHIDRVIPWNTANIVKTVEQK